MRGVLVLSVVLCACSGPMRMDLDADGPDVGVDVSMPTDGTVETAVDVPGMIDRPVPADYECAVSCGDFRCTHCQAGCCDALRDGGGPDAVDVPVFDAGPMLDVPGDAPAVDAGPMWSGPCDAGAMCPSAPFAVPICTAGHCALECYSGAGDCDDSRANGCETILDSNPVNCGACFHICPVTAVRCVAGSCVP